MKSVSVPRTKKRIGTQSVMSPLTAKKVKKRFSTTRSPRMSNCAPRGVARFSFAGEVAVEAIEGDGERWVSSTAAASMISACEWRESEKSATATKAATTRAKVIWLGITRDSPGC